MQRSGQRKYNKKTFDNLFRRSPILTYGVFEVPLCGGNSVHVKNITIIVISQKLKYLTVMLGK